MSNPSPTNPKHLHRQFLQQLPGRLQAIQQLIDTLGPGNWHVEPLQELIRLLHNLGGSAATFGLPAISAASAEVERQLHDCMTQEHGPDEKQWRTLLMAMEELELKVQQSENYHALPFPAPEHVRPYSQSPLIHLIEDDPLVAEELQHALQSQGFQIETFLTPLAARNHYIDSTQQRPAVVLMDMVFADGEDTGIELISELGLGANNGIPVIIISRRNDIDARLKALRAGASRYLVKPVNDKLLIDTLDMITGRHPDEPYRVLLIDDDPLLLEYQSEILRAAGMEVYASTSALQVLDALKEHQPDVIVLDVYMPEASGPELAAIIREHQEYLHLPILFLSGETDISQQLLALNLGGDDFLVKPVLPEHLIAAVEARARRARQSRSIQRSLHTSLYEREQEHLALNQHAIVSITDAAGNITYVNDKFCQTSGYNYDELIGHNHRIVKSGAHEPAFYQQLWETISNGHVWQGEICNRRKDGSYYWVASTITPFMDASGLPYQYVSIRTDITPIKEVEKELEAHKERLRRGQIFANIGTWDWNIRTGDLYWSERIAPLFGYEYGELETSYENFINAIHPDDREKVSAAVNASVEQDAPYDIEHRVVWPDGTVRWLHEKGAVLRDEQGQPLQMLGVVQDISARKTAELVLKQREKELSESEERFAFAVEGAGDGIWDWNIKTGEMPLSGQYEAMLGYEKGDLEPTIDAWIKSVHSDDIERVQNNLQDYLAGKIPNYTIELRLLCKDGSYKWILCRGTLVECNVDGSPLRMIGIHSDISERKLAEEQLITAKLEAERANRAKSEFLSNMSHELRTPMNAILGFSQLMDLDETLSEQHREGVTEILKAGNHLLNLINEVLDLAKVESGQIDLSLEPVELLPLVEECLTLVAPLTSKRAITITQQVNKSAIIKADRTRLKQSLINLLSNAIKYNRPQGNVNITAVQLSDNRMRISIHDTGMGIPQARMGELFAPFSRLGAEGSEIEGTGIGLTITRRIIEMMGGNIGVESTHGEGSHFWIDLPSAHLIDAEQIQIRADDIDSQPEQLSNARTVLYIEDNPANLKLIASVLGQRKYITLLTAHTPNLGIELAQAHQPDLILLDINMPGMDGYEVLAILQTMPELVETPLFALTANAMPKDIERGLEAGFTHYLTKPIDIPRFLEIIDQTLE